jgi:hypothetical protein
MGFFNMQITSDRPGVAELAPTEEQIRAAMSKPSATQEFAALCKTAIEGDDGDKRKAYRRLMRLLKAEQTEIPAGTTVTYVAHLGGGEISVLLPDGRYASMNPHCFPTLR